MSTIGIIGYGIVGQATGKAFATNKENKILWWDKFKKSPVSFNKLVKSSEVIFICVPTPMLDDANGIDISILEGVVAQIAKLKTRAIVCIKSTVIPGTTAKLAKKHPKLNFAVSPEFLTDLNANFDVLHPNRVIIGCFDEALGIKLALLHKEILDPNIKIFITEPTAAELAKYMSNTFLATKIMFANEMKILAEKLEVNYGDVQKMVGADPRIGESFLGVTPFLGFGGKCFPKDTVALLGLARELKVDLLVLESVWKKNLALRKVRDWENIEGAVSSKKHSKK